MSLNSGQKLKKFLTAFLICGAFLFVVSPNNALAARAISNYQKSPNGTLTANEWNSLMFDTVNDPELLIPGRGDFVNTWATTTMIGPLGIGTNNPLSTLDIPAGSFYVQNAAVGSLGIPSQNSVVMADPEGNLSATSSASFFVSNNILSLWSGIKNGNIWNGDVGTGNVGIGTTNPLQKLHVYSSSGDAYARIERGFNTMHMAVDYKPAGVLSSSNHEWLNGVYANTDDYRIWNWSGSSDSFPFTVQGSTGNVGVGTTNPLSTLDIPTGSFYAQDATIGGLGIPSQNSVVMADPEGNLSATSTTSFFVSNNILSLWSGTKNGDIWNGDAGTGNVGIGTTGPSRKLEVYGAGNQILVNSTTGAGNSEIGFATEGALKWRTGYGISLSSNQYEIYDSVNSLARMVIKSDGNVGIGTTGPNAKLTVGPAIAYDLTSAIAANGRISINDGVTSALWIDMLNSTTARLQVAQNGSNAGNLALMPYGGNVGIGTTNPTHILEVTGTGASNIPVSRINVTGDSAFIWGSSIIDANLTAGHNLIAMIGQAESDSNSGYIGLNYTSSGSASNFLTFGLYGHDNLLNIKPNGNIGIGTTNPLSTLDIPGSADDFYVQNATIRGLGIPSQNSVVMADPEGNLSATSSTSFFVSNNILSLWSGNKNGDIWNGDAGLGNVGIGTTNPGAKLEVSGVGSSILVSDTTAVNQDVGGYLSLYGNYNTGASQHEWARIKGGKLNATVGDASGYLSLSTSYGTGGGALIERMRITQDGNVGIGTTVPGALLQVGDGGSPWINSEGIIRLAAKNTGGGSKTWDIGVSATSNNYNFKIKDVNRDVIPFLIQWDTGNVGIGTTSPTQKLTVDGGNIEIRTGGDIMLRPTANDYDFKLRAEGYKLNIYAGGDLVNPRMTILNTGPVGIGTTNPLSTLDIPATDSSFYVQSAAIGSLGIIGQNSVVMADPEGNLSATSSTSFFVSNNILSLWSGSKNGDIWNGDAGTGNVGIGTTAPVGRLNINQDDTIDKVSGSNIGSINLTHPTSGGMSAITFKSTVNWPSDGGYLAYYDDNNAYAYWGDSTENGALILGVTNDTQSSPSDVVVIKSQAAAIVDAPSLLVPAGNVGIGTTNPVAKLQIGTAADVLGNPTGLSIIGGDLNIDNGAGATDNKIYFRYQNVVSTIQSDKALRFNTHNAEAVRILENGNVGIGTTNPLSTLDIPSSASDFYVQNATIRGLGIPSQNSVVMADPEGNLSATSTTSFFVSNNILSLWSGTKNGDIWNGDAGTGNVGIGTTNPEKKLTIVGPSSAPGDQSGTLLITDGTGINTDHKLQLGIVSNSYAWIQSVKPGTNVLPLVLNPSGGNVGIGTTGPSQKLQITGTATDASKDLAMIDYGNSAWSLNNYAGLTFGTLGTVYNRIATYPDAASSWGLSFYTTQNSGGSVTEKMRITSGGNVGIGTTAPAYKTEISGTFKVSTSSSSIILDASGNVLIGI